MLLIDGFDGHNGSILSKYTQSPITRSRSLYPGMHILLSRMYVLLSPLTTACTDSGVYRLKNVEALALMMLVAARMA